MTGTAPRRQAVSNTTSGENVTLPTIEYSGCEFLGWYFDSDRKNKAESGQFPDSDTLLYARWGVRVTFDTNGGEAAESLLVDKGESVNVLPVTIKSGNAFVGWFTDAELSEEYDYSTALQSAVTLYAKFSKNVTEVLIKMQYFEDVPEDAALIVNSEVQLTDDNVSEYLSLTNADGSQLVLHVGGGSAENEYSIKAEKNFIGGLIYTAKVKSSAINFRYVGSEQTDLDATQVSFKIEKDSYDYISESQRIHICSDDIYYYEQSVRTIELEDGSPDNGKEVSAIYVNAASETFSVGGIISIGVDQTESDDDSYYKIVDCAIEAAELNGESVNLWYIEFVTPELEDLYTSFDSYGSGTVDLENYINITKNSIAENLDKSEGIKTLSKTIGTALSQSPTVKSLADELTSDENTALGEQLMAFELNLPKVSFDISGNTVKLGISYETEIEVANVCTITISVGFSDELALSFTYLTKCVENYTIGIFDKYLIQVNTYVANNFTLSFGAEIEFSGTGGTQNKVDIAGEVMDFIKDASSDVNDFAEQLSGDPLFDEDSYALDYVELVNVPFGEIPIPLTNILTFSIGFNGVISLGGKAGIFVDINQQYVEQITIANGTINDDGSVSFYDDGFTATQNQLKSDFNLKITLKGKVGMRFGVELQLKLGIAHLNSLASVYVSATAGPYVELTGMAVFEYNYDALQKESTFNVYGGIYVDFGYYVNLKLGIDTLVYDSNTSLWSKKIRSYTYGSKKTLVRFTDVERFVPFVTERAFYYKSVYTYERMDVLNLQSGEIETGKYYYNLKCEYSAVEGQPYSEFITVGKDGAISISGKFKGTYLLFYVHIKVSDENSLIGKTIERDVAFKYMDPHCKGQLISQKTYYFYNVYSSPYSGYCREEIGKTTAYVGATILAPNISASDLPEREGYYLDTEDLWRKYTLGVLDETWDGTFGECLLSDSGIEYRLNWKLITFSADYYLVSPTSGEKPLYYTENNIYIYHSSNGYSFLVPQYEEYDTVYGYKFGSYSLPNFSIYSLSIYDNYMTGVPGGTYKVYSNGFTTLSEMYDYYNENGLKLYGTYLPVIYTVKWTAATFYTEPYSDTYTVTDYPETAGIPLNVPENFAIDQLLFDTFAITYYTNSSGERFDSLDGVQVTQSETYTAHATRTINWLTYRIEGDSIFRGYSIGSARVISGDPITLPSLEEIKAKVTERLSSYSGFIESFTVSLRNVVPETMPSTSYTVYYDVVCVYKQVSVTFNCDKATFFSGSSLVNTATYTGYYRTSDTSANLSYTTPQLFNTKFFGEEDGKLYKYTFRCWQDEANSVVFPANFQTSFMKDYVFEAVFYKTEVEFRADFKVINMYGNSYYYNSIKGNFYGKTLGELLDEYEIADPTCTDYSGKYSYEFTSWDKADSYVFGSELDLGEEIKTQLSINAVFTKTINVYTITLNADEGVFSDGTTVKTVSGTLDDITDFSEYKPTRATDADNSYRFVGWSDITDNGYSLGGIEGINFKAKNITYYAVYLSSPQERTITFNAGSVEGDQGGKGYFDLYSGKSETYLRTAYDGEYLRLSSYNIDIDNLVYTCTPLYIMCGEGDDATVVYFENGYAEIMVDGNAEYTVHYTEVEKRIYTAAFNSISRATDGDGNEVEISGFMSGYVFNKYLTGEYGDKVTAPNVTYTGYTYFKFNCWKLAVYVPDGNGNLNVEYQDIAAGETITLNSNYYLYADYYYDAEVTYTMTFNARVCYENRSKLYNDDEVHGTPVFPDGSYSIDVTGYVNNEVVFTEEPSLAGFAFIGWTDANNNVITDFGVFNGTRTYYANYERSGEYTVTLLSGNGAFSDGETSKTVSTVIGKVCSSLETPVPSDSTLAFSYYADENGNAVNSVSKEQTLTAVYAIPISSTSDFNKINCNPNGSFVLTKDIIYFGLILDDEDENMFPLCKNCVNGFSGVFNGNGYSISFISDFDTEYSGFFSKLSGKIMNVSFTAQYYVYSTNTTSTTKYIGLAAGLITEKGIVENCYFGGGVNIYAKVPSGFAMGLIAGENKGTIENCLVNSQSSSEGNSVECNGKAYVGCVVGINSGKMESVCYDGSDFTLCVANSFYLNYGSLAGLNNGEINYCVSRGDFTLNFLNGDNVYAENCFMVGSLCGKDNGTITNCYYSSSFTHTASNITLVNPEDSSTIICKLYFSAEGQYVIYRPDMYFVYCNNANVFDIVINDEDTFPEYGTNYYLSTFSNAATIRAFRKAFVFYEIAESDKNYESCFNLDNFGYQEFEIVASLNMSDGEYGWLTYMEDNSSGSMSEPQ